MAGRSFYIGKGCENCRQTGYKGRLGLFELLVSTPGLRELIARQATVEEVKNYAFGTAKMRTMLAGRLRENLRGPDHAQRSVQRGVFDDDGRMRERMKDEG